MYSVSQAAAEDGLSLITKLSVFEIKWLHFKVEDLGKHAIGVSLQTENYVVVFLLFFNVYVLVLFI